MVRIAKPTFSISVLRQHIFIVRMIHGQVKYPVPGVNAEMKLRFVDEQASA